MKVLKLLKDDMYLKKINSEIKGGSMRKSQRKRIYF